MEETRELAISALRGESVRIVGRLVEKQDKDSASTKVIQSSMFNKLRDFPDDFCTRNIFEDDVLVELLEQPRELIESVCPDNIKKNDVTRQRIKNEMNELKSAIDAAIKDMPRRKIRMAS
ncbi:MAG: hypothetical protein JSW39_10100 [Desulfobacterales bacterium]|nr:MAG: hypothetical protein JSW39_10100 [Desulfobacterales bacterium]